MKKILFFILAVLLTACGSTRVDYDYDEQVSFTTLKTYNYFPDMQSGFNQLDLDRIMNATDAILENKGYIKSDNPDFLINFMSDQYEEQSGNTVGIGIGGGGRNVGVGGSVGIPIGNNKLHHTITVDIVDAQQDELIWQAVSDSNLKIRTAPQDRVAYFTQVMKKIFEGFPPDA